MRHFRYSSLVVLVPLGLAACGNDQLSQLDSGSPPDVSHFNPGSGTGGGGYSYGYGGGNSSSSKDGGVTRDSTVPPEDHYIAPQCAVADELCPEDFSYPFNGETSVSVMGSYSAAGWTTGTPMTHETSGTYAGKWHASVNVPYNQAVQYKFKVTEADGGVAWLPDPNDANVADSGVPDQPNSVAAAITCKNPTCAPTTVAEGVFDWRDAVIYFAFVDRFNRGTSANPACSVSKASVGQNSATSANYLGGNWAGITDKINDGYFTTLGVNTIWINVPVQNADSILGAGVSGNCSGTSCTSTSEEYTGYHGYWPTDPTKIEPCFGTEDELHALVTAAHKAKLKVLFDYAMVDIHTSSPVYTNNPSWFTDFCQCGAPSCSDYDDYKCWFAPYLAHFDFTNSSAARTYSVNAALQLVQDYGNDAYRLDAIKQVDPSWLNSLRPQVNQYMTQAADGGAVQHFYMVGETYDFADMNFIASFIDPTNKLDGQFDFPLRYRLTQAMLLRDTGGMLDYPIAGGQPWTFNSPAGMKGLSEFITYNDNFYPAGAIMSPFLGNQDLPRSIHYCEGTIPSWLGSNAQGALTTNGSGSAWQGEPGLETDPDTYERLANAFAVLFTNKGAPLLYYGDEIGLPGAGDPDNRRMMQWSGYSSDQQGLHDRIAKLLQIRAGHPAIRDAVPTTLFADMDHWVYSETTTVGTAVDTIYIAVNRSDSDWTSTYVPLGLPELVLGGGQSTGSDVIPARQTRIYSSYVAATGDAGADGG